METRGRLFYKILDGGSSCRRFTCFRENNTWVGLANSAMRHSIQSAALALAHRVLPIKFFSKLTCLCLHYFFVIFVLSLSLCLPPLENELTLHFTTSNLSLPLPSRPKASSFHFQSIISCLPKSLRIHFVFSFSQGLQGTKPLRCCLREPISSSGSFSLSYE